MSTSRRIAFGTLARSTGEAAGKLASLVFFIVIARHLGEEQFGDFIFGMSLSTVLLLVAGLGMQEMIGREVAKDARRADDLVWNVAVIKAIGAVVVLLVIAAVVALQGRDLESAAAILIVSVGISFEYQAGTLYAVFDGRERQQYVATTLIVNRISTAAMGIAAAAAGASLVTIAVLFTAGSALGVVTAYWLMHRFVLQPRTRVVPREWGPLIRSSVPLGIMSLLGTVVFRTSVVLIGLIAAGSAAVGEYGAAYRLVEATLFIPTSFNVAVLPWFSRQDGRGAVPIARGFEMAIKTVLALVLPLGVVFAVFAEPLVQTLYGTEYAEAVEPLRILALLTVLWGVNTTVLTVLVSRNRPDLFTLPAVLGLVPLVVLSLVLIPAEGANGAAIAASVAGACVAVVAVVRTAHLLGRVSWVRVTTAPVAAGTVMALCAAVLSGVPWVAAAIASAVTYGATFLLVERAFAPADFAFYAVAFRRES
jgi:O-antigen/teichoic acid export membrane protein